MSDDDEEAEGPAVPLGEGPRVEGAPPARVASRLSYPIERSTVVSREGETTVRTPDGPRTVESILAESDEVYFDTRSALQSTIRDVVGHGPVPTEPREEATDEEEEATGEEEEKEDEGEETPGDDNGEQADDDGAQSDAE